MHHHEITRLLDSAADAHRREAAELVDLADRDATQLDAAGEIDSFGQHAADATSDTVQSEVDLGPWLDAGAVLTEIAAAKRRLADGRYGCCETCGRPIGEARLRALPWARRCIDDEIAFERSSHGVLPPVSKRVWPIDDAAWDPEDDHPQPSPEETAVTVEI